MESNAQKEASSKTRTFNCILDPKTCLFCLFLLVFVSSILCYVLEHSLTWFFFFFFWKSEIKNVPGSVGNTSSPFIYASDLQINASSRKSSTGILSMQPFLSFVNFAFLIFGSSLIFPHCFHLLFQQWGGKEELKEVNNKRQLLAATSQQQQYLLGS